MEKPKIFLSYSKHYTPIKNFFKSVIEDLGFEPIIFDYGSANNTLEKERSLILESDGVIGILTPDIKNLDGTWRYSDSVHTEISMAIFDNKFIQLFAINEVDYLKSQFITASTFAHLNAEIEKDSFSLDSKYVRKLFKTLLDFKYSIDNLFETKEYDVEATIRRKDVKYTQRIIDLKTIESEVRIKAVALKPVESYPVTATLDWTKEDSDGILLKKDCVTSTLIVPENITSEAIIDKNQNHIHGHKFNIKFIPQVPIGSKMDFGYDRKYANYYPATKEELDEIIKNGNLENKMMIKEGMVGQNMTMTVPTDFVLLKFIFPPGYKVTKYKVKVAYLNNDTESIEETQRVNKLVQYKFDKYKDQVTLKVEIPSPQMNLDYYLLFEPPSNTQLK